MGSKHILFSRSNAIFVEVFMLSSLPTILPELLLYLSVKIGVYSSTARSFKLVSAHKAVLT